jgi:hypothetical protein
MFCFTLLQLLLVAAHSYPSSYSGDLSLVNKGDAFGSMGVSNYEDTYSAKCVINHNVPIAGWTENTKYKFNVTTDEGSPGLGMVYLLKYKKGTTKVQSTSPTIGNNKQRVNTVTWSSTILPSSLGGESFTLYAICGAGGATDKMYVAKSITLIKAGASPTTLAPSPTTLAPSSGGPGSSSSPSGSTGPSDIESRGHHLQTSAVSLITTALLVVAWVVCA